jgi:hypothetical protein
LCFISLQTFYERLQIYEFIFLEIEQLLNIVVARYNLRHYDYPTIMKYIVFFPIIPTRLEFNFLTLFVRPIILAAASSFSEKKNTFCASILPLHAKRALEIYNSRINFLLKAKKQ